MDDRPTRMPPRWRPNEVISADRLNQLSDGAAGGKRAARPPQQVSATGLGATVLRRFKVVAVRKDYLECNAFEGVVSDTAITYIAKPFLLRASALEREFSGGTLEFSNITSTGNERTATLGATVENQVVVPEYAVGDEIYALRNIKGGTGVTREEAGSAKDIEWLDMNVDGRAWAKEA